MNKYFKRERVDEKSFWYYKDIPVNAIEIPENATNGDVLKRLLYGKAIITEFIHDVNISVNNNVIGQFDMEWWNSPYKRGDTE
jgi:hypothetical protein